jgi:hypothetical protein
MGKGSDQAAGPSLFVRVLDPQVLRFREPPIPTGEPQFPRLDVDATDSETEAAVATWEASIVPEAMGVLSIAEARQIPGVTYCKLVVRRSS